MLVLATYLDKAGSGHVLPAFEAASVHEAHLSIFYELTIPGRATWSLAVALDVSQNQPEVIGDWRSFERWAPTPGEHAALLNTLKEEEMAKPSPLSSHS